MSSLKQIAIFWFFFATSLLSMDDPHVTKTTAIPPNKIIRIVFLGKTGAGKSTIINRFINGAKKVSWSQYPKLFAIPTPFQPCNVQQFKGRDVEDHKHNQLAAVTQEPSEYVAQSDGYILKLIDSPGTADTRGIEKDIENTANIAKFLSTVGEFNVLCIVLKGSSNRETAEERYFIETLKTIIPARAYNRIFIIATYTDMASNNVVKFAESVGLPTENIFYFDNFGLTEEGHVDFSQLDFSTPQPEDEFDDPFASSEPKNSDNDKRELANRVKEAWLSGNRTYNKLVGRAQQLGTHSTEDMGRICSLKEEATQKIFAAYRKVESIEACVKDLRKAKHELEMASEAYSNAKQRQATIEEEHKLAKAEKEAADALSRFEEYQEKTQLETVAHHTTCGNCGFTCHQNCELAAGEDSEHLIRCCAMKDGYCTVCPNKCIYTWHNHRNYVWKTVTKRRERAGITTRQTSAADNFDKLENQLSDKNKDLGAKTAVREQKHGLFREFEERLAILQKEKEDLQQEIVLSYIALSFVSISSINYHVGEYYDIKIRNETDPEAKAKLNRDRDFYLEQVTIYQQKTELIPILANNIGLIWQYNEALKKPFPITLGKITDEQYAVWAGLIILKEKEQLTRYQGRNKALNDELVANNLKLKDFTIFALKSLLEG